MADQGLEYAHSTDAEHSSKRQYKRQDLRGFEPKRQQPEEQALGAQVNMCTGLAGEVIDGVVVGG